MMRATRNARCKDSRVVAAEVCATRRARVVSAWRRPDLARLTLNQNEPLATCQGRRVPAQKAAPEELQRLLAVEAPPRQRLALESSSWHRRWPTRVRAGAWLGRPESPV